MTDYLTSVQSICEAYLESTCLYDFLKKAEELLQTHLGILDTELNDPSSTDPVEQDRFHGEMKPCWPLIVENVKVGYLSIAKEIPLTGELEPVLKLVAGFVSKMPEISTKISMDSDAYQAGIYELMFSSNLERMASLRAQIGLSRFKDKDKDLYTFVINIAPVAEEHLASGLEMELRQKIMTEGDLLFEQGENLILFRVQQGEDLSEDYVNAMEKLLASYKAIACASERIKDPSHDFRLRQHYNQNEQVLLYLKRSQYRGRRFVRYDDYRLVSMVYFSLLESNKLIFGKYRYVCNKVMEICKYDEEKGSDYFETLYAYLNSRYSLSETAQMLNIHRNTVVYRIQQLKDRFGVDFDSTEECFNLNLSCRIYLIAKYIVD